MNIRSIKLKTGNLSELRTFYSETLELNISSENENYFTVEAGKTSITFEFENNSKAFYHFAFNIPENRFAESIEWLMGKAELIMLDGEYIFDFKAWNAHSVYFYDPAGNIIEFIARHILNNSSSLPFSGKSILSVSEMGMPVQNVKKFYDALSNDLHLPLFTGDFKTFTAAGDDEGLLILVHEERNWFPDCPKAEIFPLEIVLKGSIEKEVLFDRYNYLIKSVIT